MEKVLVIFRDIICCNLKTQNTLRNLKYSLKKPMKNQKEIFLHINRDLIIRMYFT